MSTEPTPRWCTHIPEDLRVLQQWVCWRLANDSGLQKPAKIPVDPATGKAASTTNPSTWGSFDEACKGVEKWRASGVGFVFNGDYTGVDLDGCVDRETGEVEPWAERIIAELGSYTEGSPSGKGVHIVVKGTKPAGFGCRRGNFEAYDHDRFFTMTGHVRNGHLKIRQCPEQLLRVLREHLGRPSVESVHEFGVAQSDDEIIARATGAKNGPKFRRLFEGQPQEGRLSEDDLALASMLAFWTGDPGQIERIMRGSSRVREKWDHRRNETTWIKGRILKALSTKQRASKPAKRNRMHKRQSQRGDATGMDRTDVGNTELFVEEHGLDIRRCPELKHWLVFDGTRWGETPNDSGVFSRIRKTVRDLAGRAAKQSDREELAWAAKCHARAKIQAIHDLARRDPKLACNLAQFDIDPWLLNCANGTLDLRTGELRDHRRVDLLTKISPVRFDPRGECPKWQQFLEQIVPDPEVRGFLQRFMGYCLTGDCSEQVFAFLYGTGANGKTVFCEVVAHILGDYAEAADFETFLARKGHRGPRNDLAALRAARMILASEAPPTARWDESVIKSFSGGDTIAARFLYGELFNFTPVGKLVFRANTKPRVYGQDYGFWRRCLLVPFEVRISKDQRDKGLIPKLKKEARGILRWLVEGCLVWQESGLNPPKAVMRATEEYKEESDPLGEWIEERCCLDCDAWTATSELYSNYKTWCDQRGEKPLSKSVFGRSLGERDQLRKRKEKVRGWNGIALRSVDTGGGEGQMDR